MIKVIIAGGRDFSDYALLKEKCDYYLQNQKDIEIVSGSCSTGVHTFTTKYGVKVYGADGLGERYAKEKGYHVKSFPAEWNKYANSAGRIRNEKMAEYADCLIAFWDGISRGTKDMINKAKKYHLSLRVILYEKK
jgi:hypothetical protein